jgi:Overcoming lysogenization defect protein-like, TOPRIM domain
MEDTPPTPPRSVGEISQWMLAELQSEALAGAPTAFVLVEGLSDYVAVETIARKRGRQLEDEGIAIVPMGGATNIVRFLTAFGPRGRNFRITGLCDAAQAS